MLQVKSKVPCCIALFCYSSALAEKGRIVVAAIRCSYALHVSTYIEVQGNCQEQDKQTLGRMLRQVWYRLI